MKCLKPRFECDATFSRPVVALSFLIVTTISIARLRRQIFDKSIITTLPYRSCTSSHPTIYHNVRCRSNDGTRETILPTGTVCRGVSVVSSSYSSGTLPPAHTRGGRSNYFDGLGSIDYFYESNRYFLPVTLDPITCQFHCDMYSVGLSDCKSKYSPTWIRVWCAHRVLVTAACAFTVFDVAACLPH